MPTPVEQLQAEVDTLRHTVRALMLLLRDGSNYGASDSTVYTDFRFRDKLTALIDTALRESRP